MRALSAKRGETYRETLLWSIAVGVMLHALRVPNIQCNRRNHVRKWKCNYCSHIYDEALGDPENGVPPGTRFEDLPEDWVCPDCGAEQSDYVLVED